MAGRRRLTCHRFLSTYIKGKGSFVRIYTCPALMDLALFLVTFAVLYAAGERHMTLAQCMWIGVVFQLAYLAFSMASGLVLSRRNARTILFASTCGCILVGTVSLLLTGFVPLLVAFAINGACCAGFFNSFQAFMRSESPPGSLSRSVGLYTLAWSGGCALGFLSSGSLYRLGMWTLCLFTLGIGGVILTVLARHRSRPEEEPSADDHVEEGCAASRRVDPRYVWVGWIIIFAAMFVQRPVTTYFPALSAKAGISPFAASVPLCLHFLIQGIFGQRMEKLRPLLYRRTPLWLFQGVGVVLFLVMWHQPSYTVCAVAVSLLGFYMGFAYFCAVYYASNSGRRSLNIGINECLVGIGSLAGLLANEWWMRRSGNEAGMYLVCGVALAGAIALQLAVATLRRHPPPKNADGCPPS
jgi:MFS family permease